MRVEATNGSGNGTGTIDAGAPEAWEAFADAFLRSEAVDAMRAALHASLDDGSTFAGIVRRAELTPVEAEVFALLAAVEIDERRQRVMAEIQDSEHLPRPTLGTLRRAFAPGHPGARAVAPGSRLARACLIEVEAGGPWATRLVV